MIRFNHLEDNFRSKTPGRFSRPTLRSPHCRWLFVCLRGWQRCKVAGSVAEAEEWNVGRCRVWPTSLSACAVAIMAIARCLQSVAVLKSNVASVEVEERGTGRSSMMTPRLHQQGRPRLELGDYCFPRSPHRLLHMPHKNISQMDGPAACSAGSTRAILFISSHRDHYQTSSPEPRVSNYMDAVILRMYVVPRARTRVQTRHCRPC